MIPSTMADIRAIVRAELESRGWTAYRLVQEAKAFPVKLPGRKKKTVSPDTVYKWLAGTRAITVPHLEPLLEALGLEVRRKR